MATPVVPRVPGSPARKGAYVIGTQVMRGIHLIGVAVAVAAAISGPASAQRGVGDNEGVVRSGVPVDLTAIDGTVTDVRRTQCANSTGRFVDGLHLIVDTVDRGVVNLHLGPAVALEDLAAVIEAGDLVSADVFRTDALPADALVATAVTVGDAIYALRDETLQPVWAVAGDRAFGAAPAAGRRGGGRGGQGGGAGQGGAGQWGGLATGAGRGFGPCTW